MKIKILLCVFLAIAAALRAAETLPVFNATLTVGKEHRFVLVSPQGKASGFLALGESFDGYKLKSYDPKAAVLEVEKDGKVSPLTITADAAVVNTPAAATKATIDDAKAVLTAMNFEQMMDKTLTGVRKGQMAMVDQMMSRMMGPGASEEVKKDVVEMQKKVLETMMAGLSGEEMKNDVAKVYSEVFSKEELRQLGEFYQSPLGQVFTDKQPELTEKINGLMAPRMMAAMPKVQEMMRDFAMQQKAKREAAGGGGTGPATGAGAGSGAGAPKAKQ